jgi:DNA-binding NarL/FixJ family response regulator
MSKYFRWNRSGGRGPPRYLYSGQYRGASGLVGGRLRTRSAGAVRCPFSWEAAVFSVAIVDEQPVSRTGLETVVSETPELRLVTSVSSVTELVPGDAAFDVVALNLSTRSGGLTLPAIGALSRRGRVVVIVDWRRHPVLAVLGRAGAHGYLTRYSEPQTIVRALSTVADGGLFVCPDLVDQFRAEVLGRGPEESACLAPREAETLRWIALGLTHAQVARRMGLTETTVNTYAKRIRAKLGAGNKAELTRLAIQSGQLTPDECGNSAA